MPDPDPDKTSVVERPNLDELAGAMQGGGAPSEAQDDAPATEVMSGDALSGMFGGQDPAQSDGTVEMQNPYSDTGGQQEAPQDDFDVAATEVVSGDAVGGMLDSIQNQSSGRQGQPQPAHQGPVDSEATVESSPPDLKSWERDNQQQQERKQPPKQQGQQRQQPSQRSQQQGQRASHPQQQPSGPSQPPKQPSTPANQQTNQHAGGQRAQAQQPAPEQSADPAMPSPAQGSQTPGGAPAGAASDPMQAFSPEPEEPANAHAPPAQGGDGAAADGPSAEYDGPWKLKTNFGLTYEFPDTTGLKNWLSNREELDGYQLAGEDGDFRPLSEWPQIGDSGPSTSQQMSSFDKPSSSPGGRSGPGTSPPPSMGAGAGSGPNQPPSTPPSGGTQPPPGGRDQQKDSIPPGKKINPQEFRPPSQEAKWNKVLWVVFLLLALVATAIGLQTFEIYDVKGLILGESTEDTTAKSAPTPPTSGEKPDDGEKAAANDDSAEKKRQQRLDEQIEQLVGDAERALENNRLQTALNKLDRAKTLDPERPKVFDMMATVYKEMGQAEKAESAEAEATRLREKSLSKNDRAEDGAEKSEN